jgi:hypothetical protein
MTVRAHNGADCAPRSGGAVDDRRSDRPGKGGPCIDGLEVVRVAPCAVRLRRRVLPAEARTTEGRPGAPCAFVTCCL